MSKTIQIETEFLTKFAEFTNLAISELNNLRTQVNAQMQKQAQDESVKENYRQAVLKVANALYNSDLEFITGDFDPRKFTKRALEDPSYLARTLEKVCNASDVFSIGTPARVAANKNIATYDPVYARAFGFSKHSNDLLELE
jgi:hypothetical protein